MLRSGAAPPTPPIVFAADRAPSLTRRDLPARRRRPLVDVSKARSTDTLPVVSPDGRSGSRSQLPRRRGGIYVAAVDGSGLQGWSRRRSTRSTSVSRPGVGADGSAARRGVRRRAAAEAAVVGLGRSADPDRAKACPADFVVAGRPARHGFVDRGVHAYRATGGVAWSVRVTDGFVHAAGRRGGCS